MSREDSGVIDLFAIHNKASAAATDEKVPADIFSSPPPAFTMDITGENAALMRLGADHEDLDPFGRKPRKKKLIMMGAAAGALLFVGILIAAFSGGSSETPRAAATKVEAAPPPPPVAAPPPAPTTEPPAGSAVNVPAPPTTGAVASSKPPSPSRGLPGRPAPAPAAKAKLTANGGSKLTKVQSAGVAAK